MNSAHIAIQCPDRTGLVAAITNRLFEVGVNLGDTSFAVLGGGAEFTSVFDLPGDMDLGEIEASLRALPELAEANVTVRPFRLAQGPMGEITHRFVISGGDRPGLVARLSEVFGEFHANIVTMDARPLPDEGVYVTRFAVSIPARVESCIATVANTAGELNLSCHVEEA
jgi:glycine cleavage system transcriptional repressor